MSLDGDVEDQVEARLTVHGIRTGGLFGQQHKDEAAWQCCVWNECVVALLDSVVGSMWPATGRRRASLLESRAGPAEKASESSLRGREIVVVVRDACLRALSRSQ